MSKTSQDSSKTCGKGAGRPKASDVQARMQGLIETAGALFLRHGYTKVSLEAIAREAHVAVRTIYVKFGGKAGLLNAVIQSGRDRFFTLRDMEADDRPFKDIVDDFARHFLHLLWAPEAISMQRVVIAEGAANPELAQAFWQAGPAATREMLARFFARPDIRAQLREDLPFAALPIFLLNSILGDPMTRFLSPTPRLTEEELHGGLDERLALFYLAVLRPV
jgi:TetR/AcrR family transcriptional regulator, mexJK operon transcriptional repressor